MRTLRLGIGICAAVTITACAHAPVQSGATPSIAKTTPPFSDVTPRYVIDGTSAATSASNENTLYMIDGTLLTNPTQPSARADRVTQPAASVAVTPPSNENALYMIDGTPLTNPTKPPAEPYRATQPAATTAPLYIIDGVPVDGPSPAPPR